MVERSIALGGANITPVRFRARHFARLSCVLPDQSASLSGRLYQVENTPVQVESADREMPLCLETQYFKLIGGWVISSWVTAVGDFIRFYSVTSS